MSEPKPSRDDVLRHVADQVERWTSPQLGALIGSLRPSVESNNASPATRATVDLLCQELARRKAAG